MHNLKHITWVTSSYSLALQLACSSDAQSEEDMSWHVDDEMGCLEDSCQPDMSSDAPPDKSDTPEDLVDLSELDMGPWQVPDGMVEIPEGTFMMGNSEGGLSGETPVREVYLSRYAIDLIEVTVARYTRCVEQGACTLPGEPTFSELSEGNLCNYGVEGKQAHPMNCIDWGQADAYCTWAGRHVPTEAQWEKAARGPDSQIYPWGNSPRPSCDLVAAKGCLDQEGTWEAGRHSGDVSPYGVRDLLGNVREWTYDLFERTYYQDSPYRDPQGPEESSVGDRSVRGQSYYGRAGFYPGSSSRGEKAPEYISEDLGFRCAYSGPNGS